MTRCQTKKAEKCSVKGGTLLRVHSPIRQIWWKPFSCSESFSQKLSLTKLESCRSKKKKTPNKPTLKSTIICFDICSWRSPTPSLGKLPRWPRGNTDRIPVGGERRGGRAALRGGPGGGPTRDPKPVLARESQTCSLRPTRWIVAWSPPRPSCCCWASLSGYRHGMLGHGGAELGGTQTRLVYVGVAVPGVGCDEEIWQKETVSWDVTAFWLTGFPELIGNLVYRCAGGLLISIGNPPYIFF